MEASGLIYDMFEKDRNTYSDDSKEQPSEACKRYITVDAGTANPTTFLAVADDKQRVWIEKEYYFDSRAEGRQKTDTEYADDFDQFVAEWGYKPYKVIIDPAAANLRLVLRRRGYRVVEAINDVKDGITKVSVLIALGLLLIHESCTSTLKEIYSYSWDMKAAEKGVEKPVKQMDHAMDAIRYFVLNIVSDRRIAKAKGVIPSNEQKKEKPAEPAGA